MTAFDQAFALSKGNTANIDIGHYVAAGNVGGTPVEFFQKHHGRITSFHIKDRTTPEHCALNLPFGEGETPLGEIFQLLRKNRWRIPATIELEYQIPEGSDPVKEVRRSVEYCRSLLVSKT
jgi:sugar phosphate isomerase/epimerase